MYRGQKKPNIINIINNIISPALGGGYDMIGLEKKKKS